MGRRVSNGLFVTSGMPRWRGWLREWAVEGRGVVILGFSWTSSGLTRGVGDGMIEGVTNCRCASALLGRACEARSISDVPAAEGIATPTRALASSGRWSQQRRPPAEGIATPT